MTQSPTILALEDFVRKLDLCWLERRYDDLSEFLDADVVMVAPGGQHRMVGLAQAIESYRGFVESSRIYRFDTSNYVITQKNETAIVDYAWYMAWEAGNLAQTAQGRDVLVIHCHPDGWRVVWRTQIPT